MKILQSQIKNNLNAVHNCWFGYATEKYLLNKTTVKWKFLEVPSIVVKLNSQNHFQPVFVDQLHPLVWPLTLHGTKVGQQHFLLPSAKTIAGCPAASSAVGVHSSDLEEAGVSHLHAKGRPSRGIQHFQPVLGRRGEAKLLALLVLGSLPGWRQNNDLKPQTE
jgi:hypothetical protein